MNIVDGSEQEYFKSVSWHPHKQIQVKFQYKKRFTTFFHFFSFVWSPHLLVTTDTEKLSIDWLNSFGKIFEAKGLVLIVVRCHCFVALKLSMHWNNTCKYNISFFNHILFLLSFFYASLQNQQVKGQSVSHHCWQCSNSIYPCGRVSHTYFVSVDK